MPFTVQDLIEDRPKPTSIPRTESVQTALRLMIEGDFSQLPVVDRQERAEGMITADSIVRALNHFDLTIKQMRVSHAMSEAHKFRPDDDLFELLDNLKKSYAAVVVDGDERVIGIVTSYDTTEYFRRRGEDFMLVEDIESTLKDYVIAGFSEKNGEINKPLLEVAISEITPSNRKLRGPFQRALAQYLRGEMGGQVPVNEKAAKEVFEAHMIQKVDPKPFDRLTLDDYIELFLNSARWSRYESAMDLDSSSCRNLLKAVSNTRNELAHFRAEITAEKRERLRFCKDWLERHQQEVIDALSPTSAVTESSPQGSAAIPEGQLATNEDLPVQLVAEDTTTEGRYARLAVHLQSLPLNHDKIDLAFKDIEAIIRSALPNYARIHRSWWANDSTSHVQSKQWLEAGWRASGINMSSERVTFSRIKEREQTYIEFYAALLAALRQRNEIPIKPVSPSGQGWIVITDLKPDGVIGYSFARGNVFRIELYIDSGVRDMNKAIFDELHMSRKEIQADFEDPLSWERLNNRRASRVAIYHPGTITDDDARLSDLRAWAVETSTKFYNVFSQMMQEARKALKNSR